ncbi:MAG: PilZ domain-containing protein [bacterium]|nr:PilZ domain-containing protein [bacterium]
MTSTGGRYSPERLHVRTKAKKKCILRIPSGDKGGKEALFVETLDHSEGGIGISFNCSKLSVGHRVFVYIETLNVSAKEAEVVWLKQFNGDCAAGLRWT